MSINESNTNKRRLQSSYITTTISLALVLFMLGLVGLLLLDAKKLSDFVKENINFTIVLKPETKEVDILKFQKELDALPFIKSTEYVTKEKAAKEFTKSLGEDFVGFLGYNPLLSSIEVKLHSAYANQDSINKVEKYFKNNVAVNEIIYEKSLINLVNENVRKISMIILCFSGILFLIAIALINNTVRLMLFSKRFIIRTMQLVGATKGFIRKPFLYRSILHGFIASLISILLTIGLIYLAQRELPEINLMLDFRLFGILFVSLIIVGVIINLICTYFATNKYLNIETELLY